MATDKPKEEHVEERTMEPKESPKVEIPNQVEDISPQCGAQREMTLREKLLKAAEGNGFPEEWFKEFKYAYGHANNKGDCACGSGKRFQDCCKLDWTMVQRYVAQAMQATKEQSRDAHKQETRQEAEERLDKEVNWMCWIGMSPKNGGVPVIRYPEGASTKYDPMQILTVMEAACKQLETNLIAGMVTHQVMGQVARQMQALTERGRGGQID